MKTYKLTFKCLSSITRLPDAQVIFGAACRIIKYTKGENELNHYLNSLLDNKPLFVHSSMFPNNLLPMVKVGLISIAEKNEYIFQAQPKEQLNYLSQLKQYKKISYVTQGVYDKYLKSGLFQELKEDLFAKKLFLNQGVISENKLKINLPVSQLVFHTNQEEDIDERGLYYDQTIYYPQNSLFDVYVKTNNIDYVKSIFQYSQYFGFGNRVSVGKNSFQLEKTEELYKNSNQSDKCILLSKCFENQFDLSDSSYVIDSKVFNGSHYYSSNKIGMYNCFEEGSYMKVLEKKEYYGKLDKQNNGKDIYHYGIGFVL